MKAITEVLAVTWMSLSALPQRIGASLVTLIGVACVVGVLISLLAIGAGLSQTVGLHTRADRAIVMSSGSAAAYLGSISPSAVSIISEAPGVKQDAQGRPMAEPIATVIVEVTKKRDGGSTNVPFEGVGPQVLEMSPTMKFVAGRMFRPAVHELIVGRAASAQFRNLGLGDRISLRGVDWTVVGVFADEGAISENALMADASTVLQAFDRNAYQMVAVQLASPSAFATFRDSLTTNPQLSVEVKRDADYRRQQIGQLTNVLNFIGYFVGGVMALGAVFGAVNTMYSAVDARAREIATLRAIGFGGLSVVVSVLIESLLVALPGALVGAAAAWVLFNGHRFSSVGLSFPLAVTPGLVWLGVIWALAIGFLGGLAPSIRAARLPVAEALRAT